MLESQSDFQASNLRHEPWQRSPPAQAVVQPPRTIPKGLVMTMAVRTCRKRHVRNMQALEAEGQG